MTSDGMDKPVDTPPSKPTDDGSQESADAADAFDVELSDASPDADDVVAATRDEAELVETELDEKGDEVDETVPDSDEGTETEVPGTEAAEGSHGEDEASGQIAASASDDAGEELSVDQLTAAFANLMGGEEADELRPPLSTEDEEEEAAAEPSSGTKPRLVKAPLDAPSDSDSDVSQVTPSSIVESILFVGHPLNEPLTARLMASYLRGVSPSEVDEMIVELNQTYEAQQAAYRIASEGAGYRMTLREDLSWLRESFYGKVREAKLTQAAIDLLAIVAYHQPAERARIDNLRGQPSGGVLNQLVRRELLSVEYTEEKPRKKLYRTTDRFLALFGLDSIEDLPSYDDF